jgi:hypothetical protein
MLSSWGLEFELLCLVLLLRDLETERLTFLVGKVISADIVLGLIWFVYCLCFV